MVSSSTVGSVDFSGDLNVDYYNWNNLTTGVAVPESVDTRVRSKPRIVKLPSKVKPGGILKPYSVHVDVEGQSASGRIRLVSKETRGYKFETEQNYWMPLPGIWLSQLKGQGVFINVTASLGPDDDLASLRIDEGYSWSLTVTLGDLTTVATLLSTNYINFGWRTRAAVLKFWAILKPNLDYPIVSFQIHTGWVNECNKSGDCVDFNVRVHYSFQIDGWASTLAKFDNDGFEVVEFEECEND